MRSSLSCSLSQGILRTSKSPSLFPALHPFFLTVSLPPDSVSLRYRSCSTLDGPYDPDSEPVEVEEISHKDETELSPKDLISRSFEEPNNDGSLVAASASSGSGSGEVPTRSIMRRASIFGPSKTTSGEKKASRTADPNSKAGKANSMSNLFSELKEKSDRKGPGAAAVGRGGVGGRGERGGGGMMSMMEEMKQKSLKRNASLKNG
jgi:hypothetical protein